MAKETVAMGMSGGVDSSVAAAVLLEQGYAVIGVTMRLFDGEKDAFADAARVCETLGIPHRVVDFRKEFRAKVMDYFAAEYQRGRTPNPCVACNRHLKFGAMAEAAEAMGADKIATGHYARIEQDAITGRYLLRCAESAEKDQTYALYSLTQKQLSRTLMPLGAFADKQAVRRKAEELGLPTASKSDSMEICFVPDKDYAGFLHTRYGVQSLPGNFTDRDGNVLGEHRGIVHYTVGQRKGLGIAFGKPMFVTEIIAEENRVVLGESGTEYSSGLIATEPNFIPFDSVEEEMRVLVKIRYSAQKVSARLTMEESKVRVRFDTPQRAVTPGQAVVFYAPEGDLVLGGATIEKQE